MFLAVERVDRGERTAGVQLDETEPTRPAGLPVVDGVHAVHRAVLLEGCADLARARGGVEGPARTGRGALAASAEWKPIYSTVGGKLPRAELSRALPGEHREEVILLRFRLEVSTPGALRLEVDFAGVARAFVGSSRVTSLALTLECDIHPVTPTLAKEEIRSDSRVELVDAPGSTAKARIVTGK